MICRTPRVFVKHITRLYIYVYMHLCLCMNSLFMLLSGKSVKRQAEFDK